MERLSINNIAFQARPPISHATLPQHHTKHDYKPTRTLTMLQNHFIQTQFQPIAIHANSKPIARLLGQTWA
jgi:hypothetical protein